MALLSLQESSNFIEKEQAGVITKVLNQSSDITCNDVAGPDSNAEACGGDTQVMQPPYRIKSHRNRPSIDRHRVLKSKRLKPSKEGEQKIQAIFMMRIIIRKDIIQYLLENWQQLFTDALRLRDKTMLPDTSPLSFDSMIPAVIALEGAMMSDAKPLSRFGFAYFSMFLDSLETKIKLQGMFTSERGRGNASVAIDLYINALAKAYKPKLSRRHLHECRRIGNRWRALSQAARLLLVVYSEKLDGFVKSPSQVDEPTFKLFASAALAKVPPNVYTVCVQLAEAEKSFKNGSHDFPLDRQFKDEVEQCLLNGRGVHNSYLGG